MSDVLFRYLLTARRRDRSVLRRLVFADEPLLAAGLEQLVETAAARVEVTSQHERVGQRTVTVPASRHRRVRFYDVARPNRPREGRFERRSEAFPLRPSLRIYPCTACGGAGEITCRRCAGRGVAGCPTCGASRRRRGRRRACRVCGGRGDATCRRCRGRGRVTCGSCRGEGQLASWEVEVYQWLVASRAGEETPRLTEEARVRHAFRRWLKADPDRVANFEPAAVEKHLGYRTPEALEVAARADAHRRRLEDEARSSADRYLFHRTDRSLAPVGYTLMRLAGRGHGYWLVGRGEHAREVTPRGRPDAWKCLGWLGLGSGGTLGYEGVVQAWDLALPVLEGLTLFAEMPLALLAGGSAASWLLTLAGVRRLHRRQAPVQTVGLIVRGGRPTPFLTCLAYLGSYLGRLTVSDRAYDLQSERLLGRMRPDRQSESLSIELPDGRKVRLVEVARPDRLSDAQVRLMARALDAVMFLEAPEPKPSDLPQRVASAAPALPTGALAIGAGGDLREAAGPLPLETIRRTFVEDLAADVDWPAVFERMWRPLDALLGGAGAPRRAGAGRR